MRKVSVSELQASLTTEEVWVFRIIYFVIISGISVFFGVVLYMYFFIEAAGDNASYGQDMINTLNAMTMIHLVFLLVAMAASGYIYSFLLSEKKMGKTMDALPPEKTENSAVVLFRAFRTAKIIQITAIETPAFFGLVICFLAVTSRVIHDHSFYWFNSLSYFIFIVKLVRDFPGKEKLLDTLKKKFHYLLVY